MSLIEYELCSIWWLVLFLAMFNLAASQLFVNCWVRAAASIVRAKRCYFDDILDNSFENTLFLFSSYVFFSYSLLLFLFCFFFSLSSSHIQVASSCNRKRRFPFIARTDLRNSLFFLRKTNDFGTLKLLILDLLLDDFSMTQSDFKVTSTWPQSDPKVTTKTH